MSPTEELKINVTFIFWEINAAHVCVRACVRARLCAECVCVHVRPCMSVLACESSLLVLYPVLAAFGVWLLVLYVCWCYTSILYVCWCYTSILYVCWCYMSILYFCWCYTSVGAIKKIYYRIVIAF